MNLPCRNPFLSWQSSILRSGTKMNTLCKVRTQMEDQRHGWGVSDQADFLGNMDDGNELWGGMFWATLDIEGMWTRDLMYMCSFLSVKLWKHLSYRKLNHNGCVWSSKQQFLTIMWVSVSFEILYPEGKYAWMDTNFANNLKKLIGHPSPIQRTLLY